ncbi:MAG TPA: hypothetical protein VF160_09905 [Candidatus Dormibacteraeota bacterium]
MPAVAERLDRLRLAQTEGAEGQAASGVAPLAATILLALLIVSSAVAALLLKPERYGLPATQTTTPSATAVAARAGLTPHLLYGAKLETATYVPASSSKPPVSGVAGIALIYRTNSKSVEVLEFRDPSPDAALAVDPAKQAPATSTTISGVSCLVWSTPDRSNIVQLGFKTADGLVIYVMAIDSNLRPDDVVSIVTRLKGATAP